jgi:hypothetical protein
MAVLMLIMPAFGLPRVSIPGVLSVFMGMTIGTGWIAYFTIGTFLAIGFALIFAGRMLRSNAGGGMIYSFMLWLAVGLIVLPVLDMPLFGGDFFVAFTCLIGYLAYGATVGAIYHPALSTTMVPATKMQWAQRKTSIHH